MQTADCRLQTGYKMQTETKIGYKMQTDSKILVSCNTRYIFIVNSPPSHVIAFPSSFPCNFLSICKDCGQSMWTVRLFVALKHDNTFDRCLPTVLSPSPKHQLPVPKIHILQSFQEIKLPSHEQHRLKNIPELQLTDARYSAMITRPPRAKRVKLRVTWFSVSGINLQRVQPRQFSVRRGK